MIAVLLYRQQFIYHCCDDTRTEIRLYVPRQTAFTLGMTVNFQDAPHLWTIISIQGGRGLAEKRKRERE